MKKLDPLRGRRASLLMSYVDIVKEEPLKMAMSDKKLKLEKETRGKEITCV